MKEKFAINPKSKIERGRKVFSDFGFDLSEPENKEFVLKVAKLVPCIWKEFLGDWRCKMRKDERFLEEILKDKKKKRYLYFRLALFILNHPKRKAHIKLKDKFAEILRNERLASFLARHSSGLARYALRPQLVLRGPVVNALSFKVRGQLLYKSSKKLGTQIIKKLGLKFIAKYFFKKPLMAFAKLNPYSLIAIYFYDIVLSIIGQKELDRIIKQFLEKEPLD